MLGITIYYSYYYFELFKKFKIKFVLENPNGLLFQDDWRGGGEEHKDTSDVFVALPVLAPLPKALPFLAHKTTTYSPLPQGQGLLSHAPDPQIGLISPFYSSVYFPMSSANISSMER